LHPLKGVQSDHLSTGMQTHARLPIAASILRIRANPSGFTLILRIGRTLCHCFWLSGDTIIGTYTKITLIYRPLLWPDELTRNASTARLCLWKRRSPFMALKMIRGLYRTRKPFPTLAARGKAAGIPTPVTGSDRTIAIGTIAIAFGADNAGINRPSQLASPLKRRSPLTLMPVWNCFHLPQQTMRRCWSCIETARILPFMPLLLKSGREILKS